jgi:hypothetical protein
MTAADAQAESTTGKKLESTPVEEKTALFWVYKGVSLSNRLSSSWSWDRADYNVVFKNDRA